MADIKISELISANVVNKDDLLYVVQNSESKNVTAGTLFSSIVDPTLAGNVFLGGNVQTLTTAGIISTGTTRTELVGGVSADANAIANGSILPATIYFYTANVSASGRGLVFADGTPFNQTIYVSYKNNKINLVGSSGSGTTYPPEDWQGPTGLRPFPNGLYFVKGSTYTFDLSDPTNAGNVIGLSTAIDGVNTLGPDYTANVARNGTPGTPGANIIFTPANVAIETGGKAYLDIQRGTEGQIKLINLKSTSGGTFTLSSNIANNIAIEFRKTGDSALLLYTGNSWTVIGATPGFLTTFSGTSDDVTEGSKLYFTNARARAAITAADNSIDYDPVTGLISANLLGAASITGSDITLGNLTLQGLVTGNLLVTNYIKANGITIQGIDVTQTLLASNVSSTSLSANVINSGNIFTNIITGNIWNNLYTANVIESSSNLYYTNARVQNYLQNVTGNLLPSAPNLYDIGSNDKPWRDLWLYGNSIKFSNSGSISYTSNTVTIVDGAGYVILSANANSKPITSATGTITADLLNAVPNYSTSNIREGSNLYFTNARVFDAFTNANATLNNLTLLGDLVVQGNTVTLNVGTVNVEDKNIVLANGAINAAAANGAGISIDGAQANITYQSSGDKFVINKALEVTGDVLTTNITAVVWNGIYTDNVIEGLNLYYTNDRVLAYITPLLDAKANVADLTTSNVSELDNLYYTNDRVLAYVTPLLDVKANVADLTTSNVLELDNLYYTNARVIDVVQNTQLSNLTVLSNIVIGNGEDGYITGVQELTANVITANIWNGIYTANVVESPENLYFTNTRANAAVQPSIAELRALIQRFTSNVIYVATNGNDANSGNSAVDAYANIHVALARATPWTTVYVKSGDYKLYEQPVTIPARVALIGDNLRTTTVRPSNVTQDMFYVNNASYVTGFTFRDHQAPSAVFSFNPNGSAGYITTSPYIQNSSSITTTGTGMRVNGSYVSGLRSMVCDSYTQTNEGGVGIHMLNRGYTQLVSVFTICCHIGILCESGGFCSITNSNSSFGTYALYADGVSDPLYYGKVESATTGPFQEITLNNLSQRPNYGDSVIFANYNQAKCSRDIGLIVDSLVIDLAFGSNTQSNFAALQYWSQSESAIPNQSTETLAAINYARNLATNVVLNTTVTPTYQGANTQVSGTAGSTEAATIVDTEFKLISNIISNGTVGVTDLIIPNSYVANTNAGLNDASNIIGTNYAFIASEVLAYVNNVYPAFSYNMATCYRDVGYILDTIRFDLLHGGNRQAVTAGTYYYTYNANATQIANQVVQTTAAYDYIGSIIPSIVKAIPLATTYQVAVTQNTTAASGATNTEANLVLNNIDLITNIIENGPSVAQPKKPIANLYATANTDVLHAVALIDANKNFIKAEVTEYINRNWANISNGTVEFYTVRSASNLIANVSTITLLETVPDSILANTTVAFHSGSYISASGQTMEYVGSGDTIATALPYLGGVPRQENEVTQLRGGKVFFTSTDQLGDFRIGTGLVINRVDGTITGRTFNKAMFAVMTPYILALEG